MVAHLVHRCHDQMASLGLDNLGHVPFLLGMEMSYLDEANRFLRLRSSGTWSLSKREATAYSRSNPLSANTVLSYANDLKNFWSYLEARQIDWRNLEFQQLLDTYDRDMMAGRWRSRGSRGLAASTINRRMRTALEFLLWAADQRLREPFHIAQSKSYGRRISRNSWASPRTEMDRRVGMHRIDPKRCRLPSSDEITSWLSEVRNAHGRARYLAIKFILQTGCRLEEVANARVVQLPDPASIDLDMPARMDIVFGTKGQRVPGDAELKGKPRSLRFNRSFAVELNNYRQLGRRKSLAIFKNKNPTSSSPIQIFLDEKTGKPLSKQSIYRAWNKTRPHPIPGWSPHLGRHAFACFLLLRLVNEENSLLSAMAETMPRSQIIVQLENLISVFIRPVMGHVDDRTTEGYIEWIADHLWVAEHRREWTNYLEEGCDQ